MTQKYIVGAGEQKKIVLFCLKKNIRSKWYNLDIIKFKCDI